MDLDFRCPHCDVPFEAAQELLGTTIECPACRGRIALPHPRHEEVRTPIPPPAPSMPSEQFQSWSPPLLRRKKTAPGAAASLVLGILGLFICGLIFGAFAISKANKAKKLIKENPDQYTGSGLATAGLVMGTIDLVGWGLALLINLIAISSR